MSGGMYQNDDYIEELEASNKALAAMLTEWTKNFDACTAVGKTCKGDPCDCIYCRSIKALAEHEE